MTHPLPLRGCSFSGWDWTNEEGPDISASYESSPSPDRDGERKKRSPGHLSHTGRKGGIRGLDDFSLRNHLSPVPLSTRRTITQKCTKVSVSGSASDLSGCDLRALDCESASKSQDGGWLKVWALCADSNWKRSRKWHKLCLKYHDMSGHTHFSKLSKLLAWINFWSISQCIHSLSVLLWTILCSGCR